MFKNYLKITLRNIKRHKAYSLINILGLAIGIALCVLILVYVQDELSYDNFHENGDRIYRIVELEDHDGDLLTYMRIGPGVTEKLKVDFPDSVENTVRLLPADDVWTKFEDKLFQEDRVYVADETFFHIFSFNFISGDQETALKEPNSIVLNKTTAEKYFGSTEAVGKMVQVDIPGSPLLKVTAVVEDMPSNSHFHPDLLVSLSTIRNEQNQAFFDDLMYGNVVWSYILFKEGYPAEKLESQLPAFLEKHLNEAQKKRVKEFYLQPLRDIHLRSSTDPFTEIEEIGSDIHCQINDNQLLEIFIKVNSIDVIPRVVKTTLKSGKLSIKDMPKTRFYALYQDYLCGCVLRIARETFVLLPIDMLLVTAVGELLNLKTGRMENRPILSVAISRKILESLNFQSLDPSDAVRNFVHNMNFMKTKGFQAVKRLDSSDFDAIDI